MSSLSAVESAFVLIGIVLVVGLLLVWALFELEVRPHSMQVAPTFCKPPTSAEIHAVRLG